MKMSIRLGLVCLARKTFNHVIAEDIYKRIKKDLMLLEQTEIIAIEPLIFEIEDAQKAATYLASQSIDALVIISGTFHLGHLTLELHKRIERPLLLWGLTEPPYTGGKICLNSVCGVNLDASNLYKSGSKNYTICIGDQIDENWVDAIRIRSAFNQAHVGILGYRAKGFFNLNVNELQLYQQLGILVDHYELSDIWDFHVGEEEIHKRDTQIQKIFNISELSKYQQTKVAQLSAKFALFMYEKKIDALAIRCWPEFASEYGIAPCAAMSLLQSEHQILACEGDLEGAISMLAQRAIGAKTPFLFDLSQANFEENTALLWHCGVAPCNLWDGRSKRSLSTYFADGKGVTADFVLREGNFSTVRIDSADSKYRIFLSQGTVIPMEQELRGTYMKARFQKPIKDIFSLVVENGLAHHASLVYGDFCEPFRILAKIQNWQLIE